jgi:hypothetical protein
MTAKRATRPAIRSVCLFALISIAGPDTAAAAPPKGDPPRPAPAAAPAKPATDKPAAAGAPTSRSGRRGDRQRAEAAMKRGIKLIAARDYDAAIEAINWAYALDPKTEHLYNLGVAHHLKGDRANALVWYQKFLASGSTNRKLVAAAKGYADKLTAEIDAEKKAEAQRKAALAAEEAAAAEAARQRAAREELERQTRLAAAQRAERDRLARERDSWRDAANAGRGKRLLGASLLVAGGASLGVALVAGLEARSANEELDNLGEGDTWTVSRDWLHERGESAEKRAIIFSIAAAGLAAGGGFLYFLGEREARRSPEERSPVITPVVGSRSAGLSVAGRF